MQVASRFLPAQMAKKSAMTVTALPLIQMRLHAFSHQDVCMHCILIAFSGQPRFSKLFLPQMHSLERGGGGGGGGGGVQTLEGLESNGLMAWSKKSNPQVLFFNWPHPDLRGFAIGHSRGIASQ